MKKFCFIILAIVCCIVCVYTLNLNGDNNDYLRFHVRANSNSSFDQYVKYEVKDKVVALLNNVLDDFDTYDSAYKFLSSSTLVIEEYANSILKKKNCSYKAHVKIDKEYFEEKEGDGFTMKAGIYNSLIVSLGEGKGNNWWCLVYPSLSFVPTGNVVDYSDIVYKSKLAEIYKNIINYSN